MEEGGPSGTRGLAVATPVEPVQAQQRLTEPRQGHPTVGHGGTQRGVAGHGRARQGEATAWPTLLARANPVPSDVLQRADHRNWARDVGQGHLGGLAVHARLALPAPRLEAGQHLLHARQVPMCAGGPAPTNRAECRGQPGDPGGADAGGRRRQRRGPTQSRSPPVPDPSRPFVCASGFCSAIWAAPGGSGD